MSGPKDSKFDVWPTQVASEGLSKLRGPVRKEAERFIHNLRRVGCQAAHYRLNGLGVDWICSYHLPYNHRILVAFPARAEVVVLLVGPHDEKSDLDVYARLFEFLGIQPPEPEKRKPACCDDGASPVETSRVNEFIDRAKELRREQRRKRRRGTRAERARQMRQAARRRRAQAPRQRRPLA